MGMKFAFHFFFFKRRGRYAEDGAESVRGGALDGVFIGLWLTRSDGTPLEMGGFDGGYTYFASPTTSHGADPDNWWGRCKLELIV